MKKVKVKVVGIKETISKKGEKIAIVYIECEDKGTKGVATDYIFNMGTDTDKIIDIDVGDEIDVIEHNFKHFMI